MQRRLVELLPLSQFMVYDDAKLLLFPTFFSGRTWVLCDIENNSFPNTRWLGLEDKKEEKKNPNPAHRRK